MQSSMIPVVKRERLKGSIKANHRLALELAITKRSEIHTKTVKAVEKAWSKKPR